MTGLEFDVDGDLLIVEQDKYCVRRYYLQNNTHDVYAGACGVYANTEGELVENF